MQTVRIMGRICATLHVNNFLFHSTHFVYLKMYCVFEANLCHQGAEAVLSIGKPRGNKQLGWCLNVNNRKILKQALEN
jgi:hypothetical protein